MLKRNTQPSAHLFPGVEFRKISKAAQVEAKLEQEAEEPHVPLDLAFKQGETIKVTFVKMWSPFLLSGLQQSFVLMNILSKKINIPSKKRTKSPGRANACGAGPFTIIIVLISSY